MNSKYCESLRKILSVCMTYAPVNEFLKSCYNCFQELLKAIEVSIKYKCKN